MAQANRGEPAQERELRARGKRTMRRLLDAGIEVFARRGFHAARVDDIVDAAGLSHGTFYLYFSNKEDLLRILVLDVAEEMEGLARNLGSLTPDEEGREVLREWLREFTELYERFAPIIGAWTEAERPGDEAGRIGTDLLGGFTSALARRIATSPASGIDPNVAALALLAMIERSHYYVHAGMLGGRGEGVLDTLTEVTHHALFGSAAPSR